MLKQLALINPIARSRADKIEKLQAGLAAMGRNDISISAIHLDKGPVSVESSIDEALCGPGLINKALDAEKLGAQAIVIDCLGDPGLDAVREAVTIPVIGPGMSAYHLACTLGHKFAVVTVLGRLRPLIEAHAVKYGVHAKLGAVKAVEVSVLDIEDELFESVAGKALEAINECGVDVIVLGCTGFLGLEQLVRQRIKEEIDIEVPVINPLPVAVLTAANLIDLNLSHSGLAYPAWPSKEVKGFDFMGAGFQAGDKGSYSDE